MTLARNIMLLKEGAKDFLATKGMKEKEREDKEHRRLFYTKRENLK